MIEDGSHAGYIFRLTVSIGVAVMNEPAGPLADLVVAADTALGKARTPGATGSAWRRSRSGAPTRRPARGARRA